MKTVTGTPSRVTSANSDKLSTNTSSPLTGVLARKKEELERTQELMASVTKAHQHANQGKKAFGNDPSYQPAKPLTHGTRTLHRSSGNSSLMGKLGSLFKAKAHGTTPDSKRTPLLGGTSNSYGTAASSQSENDM